MGRLRQRNSECATSSLTSQRRGTWSTPSLPAPQQRPGDAAHSRYNAILASASASHPLAGCEERTPQRRAALAAQRRRRADPRNLLGSLVFALFIPYVTAGRTLLYVDLQVRGEEEPARPRRRVSWLRRPAPAPSS